MEDEATNRLHKYEFVNYKPSNITFYNHDREVLLREPSLLAIDAESGAVLALGKEAAEVRESGGIAVGSPLRNGIVADFERARNVIPDSYKIIIEISEITEKSVEKAR